MADQEKFDFDKWSNEFEFSSELIDGLKKEGLIKKRILVDVSDAVIKDSSILSSLTQADKITLKQAVKELNKSISDPSSNEAVGGTTSEDPSTASCGFVVRIS